MSANVQAASVLPSEPADCIDTLIELLFYEAYCRRLSPEMQALLDRHLRQCPECRRRLRSMDELLGSPEQVH